MRPAAPGPRVARQTARTPRSSRKRETKTRRRPARPLSAAGFRTRCASRRKVRGKIPEPPPSGPQHPSDINLDPRVKLRAEKLLRERSKGYRRWFSKTCVASVALRRLWVGGRSWPSLRGKRREIFSARSIGGSRGGCRPLFHIKLMYR